MAGYSERGSQSFEQPKLRGHEVFYELGWDNQRINYAKRTSKIWHEARKALYPEPTEHYIYNQTPLQQTTDFTPFQIPQLVDSPNRFVFLEDVLFLLMDAYTHANLNRKIKIADIGGNSSTFYHILESDPGLADTIVLTSTGFQSQQTRFEDHITASLFEHEYAASTLFGKQDLIVDFFGDAFVSNNIKYSLVNLVNKLHPGGKLILGPNLPSYQLAINVGLDRIPVQYNENIKLAQQQVNFFRMMMFEDSAVVDVYNRLNEILGFNSLASDEIAELINVVDLDIIQTYLLHFSNKDTILEALEFLFGKKFRVGSYLTLREHTVTFGEKQFLDLALRAWLLSFKHFYELNEIIQELIEKNIIYLDIPAFQHPTAHYNVLVLTRKYE